MAVPFASSAMTHVAGSPVMSTYEERPIPSGPLSCLWRGETGWSRQIRLLPDGCVDLTWSGGQIDVVRPSPLPLRANLPATSVTLGARLRPGWAAAVLGVALDGLPPRCQLSELWPASAVRQVTEMLGSWSFQVPPGNQIADLPLRAEPDPRIIAAVGALEAVGGDTGTAARVAELSDRHFRRRFANEVGLAPKAFQAIARFQAFRRSAATGASLARLAAVCGYADQAHLAHECRRLAWATPAQIARPRGTRVAA
jgi:AraC-like DNA-binding protein